MEKSLRSFFAVVPTQPICPSGNPLYKLMNHQKFFLPHATFAPFQDIKKVNANKSKRNAASNLHTKKGHGKVPFN